MIIKAKMCQWWDDEMQVFQVVKETREKEETKRGKEEEESCRWICRQAGCLSWMRKRHREKHKPTNNHTSSSSSS